MTDPADPNDPRLDAVIDGIQTLLTTVGQLRADVDALTREVSDLRREQARLLTAEGEIRRRSEAIDRFLEVQSGVVSTLSARYLSDLVDKAQG